MWTGSSMLLLDLYPLSLWSFECNLEVVYNDLVTCFIDHCWHEEIIQVKRQPLVSGELVLKQYTYIKPMATVEDFGIDSTQFKPHKEAM